jgi:hypothetical protein
MKALLVSLLVFFAFSLNGETPYRSYLLSKVFTGQIKNRQAESWASVPKINFSIPRYETPKGSVFCRLEDKLIRSTKVWIKVGVK